LSFVAVDSGEVVGTLRMWSVTAGSTRPALLLGPLAVHPDWRVEWRRAEPYTLEELRGHLTKADVRKEPTPQTTYGAGRNCTVFNELRVIAYREVLPLKRNGGTRGEWKLRCEALAEGLNKQFPVPLSLREVRAIAKSVAYWTWEKFTEAAFSKIQQARIKKRWAGHVAESATKPWEALGISRRTYYNRKREGKL
jgi:hypothetical protein